MSVKFTEVCAVRIVCDSLFRERVLHQLIHLGASGYTWWEAHGKGEHETMEDVFSGLVRVYIETWCQREVAEKITEYCQSEHFRGVGMAVGIQPLLVPEETAHKFHLPGNP